MMSNLRFLVKYLAITALCAGTAYLLARTLNPLAGLDAHVGPDEVKRLGTAFAESLGVQTAGMSLKVETGYDPDLLKEAYRVWGLAEGSRLLASEVPGYYWQLTWGTESDGNVTARRRGSDSERDASEMAALLRRPVKMTLDMKGDLLEYSRVFGDSVEMPSMSPDSAREVARIAVRRFIRIIPPMVAAAMPMTNDSLSI